MSIFRAKSLERLSSPERLDTMMQVTTPRGWMALCMVGILLALAITWACLGRLGTKATGTGILLRQGGLTDVVALGSGQVSEINVKPGDVVRRGQIVARVAQPILLADIQNTRATLEAARAKVETLEQFYRTDAVLQDEARNQQQASLMSSIETFADRERYLQDQVVTVQGLLTKGLATPSQLADLKAQLDNVRTQSASNRIKVDGLKLERLNREQEASRTLLEARTQVDVAERRLAQLESQSVGQSRVIARSDGRVVELKVSAGTVVGTGMPVMSIEALDANLQAVLYVPASKGKLIHQNMQVHIQPSTVKREEHGSLLALVTRVDPYPATPEGMQRILGNRILVESMSKQEAPIAIYADLIPADKSVFPSGYRWTSSRGPSISIETGTVVSAEVTIEEQPPISLVIPFLRSATGL